MLACAPKVAVCAHVRTYASAYSLPRGTMPHARTSRLCACSAARATHTCPICSCVRAKGGSVCTCADICFNLPRGTMPHARTSRLCACSASRATHTCPICACVRAKGGSVCTCADICFSLPRGTMQIRMYVQVALAHVTLHEQLVLLRVATRNDDVILR